MSTGKRLIRYTLHYKKMIGLALALLTLAVIGDLAGPVVAKTIIDKHILGIQSYWYETTEGKDSVPYDGTFIKREAYFKPDEERGKKATIVQEGLDFFYVEGTVPLDVKKKWNGNQVTFILDGKKQTATAVPLPKKQVLAFYGPEVSRIMKLIAFYFGILVLSTIFQYGQNYYLQKSANRIIQRMRNELFTTLSRLPIRFFDNLPAGKIVSRITNDTEAIKELYMNVLSNFFLSSVYIIGIYIALFLLNMKLALLCLILLPILVAWTLVYRTYGSRFNKVIRARISDLNGMINESIQGMNIIQAFGREEETKESFEKLNEEHFTFQNKMMRLNSFTSHNLVTLLRNLAFVAFIAYFGHISLDGTGILSMGMLYAYVDYLNRLFQPIQSIVNQFANLEQALVAGERVFELLDEKGTDVSETHIERYKGDVSFEHVWFGYKDDDYVLKDITFSAKQGETIAFVGHTGSGKSSIMNLLFRYYDPQKGKITIDGKDVTMLPQQAIREHMGIVLQDPYLFTGTIASNVSLNEEKITREMVKDALSKVGAEQVLLQVEGGIDAPVIEKGSTLSSGQRQLISFARALAFKPAILILDEATSNIDTETEFLIQQALEVLKKGRTTFIIAHRLSTIKNADCILVLDKGRIVEQGNHEELIQLKGKYYSMYKMQVGGIELAM
ncbi:ABC transporter ATP-binding protein [Bacillus testis]|uniref:ABC transporter ATP-binding protein n=1 Tax=Bacillus testis TaxID=1622072 RepID=UPI00067F4ECE|nr:ABC transporter ATP-binding protein [Bacillus testis]